MKLRTICMAAPLALATAFGAFTLGTPAQADTYASADNEIVIPAPYTVSKNRSTRDGEITSVSRTISYRGLDLRRQGDIDELNLRVEYAVADVCKVDSLTAASFGTDDNRDCYYDAMKDARKQVRDAVWRANYYR